MPLKSKAQLRKLGELVKQGKMSESKFKEFITSTPNIKTLPERIGPIGIDRIKKVKKI